MISQMIEVTDIFCFFLRVFQELGYIPPTPSKADRVEECPSKNPMPSPGSASVPPPPSTSGGSAANPPPVNPAKMKTFQKQCDKKESKTENSNLLN